ncbi:MAG: helix-turn-helix transcriptional regulator [Bacteroidales bacterium]
MKQLINIEFYTTPLGEVMICEDGKKIREYQTSDLELTALMLAQIKEFYPKAFEVLCEIYNKSILNKTYYDYLIVKRFIKCNFGEYDNKADISSLSVYQFEYVKCPLRGECKYSGIICNPDFCSSLSIRELEIMKMLCDGAKIEEVADTLYISILTVKQHKRNSLAKVGLHSLNEFIIYAQKNNLFK